MKKLILAAALIAAAAFPTSALAGTFTGVVVGKGGGNLAAASRSGVVRTVHTRAHPRLGARVRVSGTTVHVLGQAQRARIHAVIVRRLGRTIFLAAGAEPFWPCVRARPVGSPRWPIRARRPARS